MKGSGKMGKEMNEEIVRLLSAEERRSLICILA